MLWWSTLQGREMQTESLCVHNKKREALSEKLRFLQDRRKKIEPFCDPLDLQYDPDLTRLKFELDEQIQQLHVQIHNAEYSNFCNSIDFVLGVKEWSQSNAMEQRSRCSRNSAAPINSNQETCLSSLFMRHTTAATREQERSYEIPRTKPHNSFQLSTWWR